MDEAERSRTLADGTYAGASVTYLRKASQEAMSPEARPRRNHSERSAEVP
jgi:hypothetical protein